VNFLKSLSILNLPCTMNDHTADFRNIVCVCVCVCLPVKEVPFETRVTKEKIVTVVETREVQVVVPLCIYMYALWLMFWVMLCFCFK